MMLEMIENIQVVLSSRAREIEAMVESIEEYVEELKEFKNQYAIEYSKVLYRDGIIIDLCGQRGQRTLCLKRKTKDINLW